MPGQYDVSAEYDVAVVGYGPVGMVTAALLGRLGHRVVVLERHEGLYNLPRAATFDDETMRTLAQLGLAERLAPTLREQHTYEWCNGAGDLLLEQHFAPMGRSGWAEWHMMYQPDLEDALDELCRSLDGVNVRQGCQVTAVQQGEGQVRIEYLAGGEPAGVSARYVIGCDGGNSFVRAGIGARLFDYGFSEPWMVCDFRLNRVPPAQLPMARQVGDPAAPTSIISLGPRHHRFSFMLDSVSDFGVQSDPALVWQRVAGYLTPEDAELIRVATYTFRSLVADRWRDGAVLLAGDAAHQMPPFLGQGMCSGIRDAQNIAFKLDRVLRGELDDTVLDTYQTEREPQVRAVIEIGVQLGRRQTMRDPRAAAERDRTMLAARAAGQAPAKVRLPGIGTGLLSQAHPLGAGQLSVQGVVGVGDEEKLLDDVTGGGFCLLALPAAASELAGYREQLQKAGVQVVEIGSTASPVDQAGTGRHVVDAAGTYQRWFAEVGCVAVAIRPDFYVYGAVASPADVLALARDVVNSLCPVPIVQA